MKAVGPPFTALVTNLVQAGEIGGILDTILNRLAVYLEKADKLARKVKGAMVYPLTVLVVAGGVSANHRLRERLDRETAKRQAQAFYPRGRFCTDNGAMIAYVGAQRLLAGERDDATMQATPRWPLASLTALAPSDS